MARAGASREKSASSDVKRMKWDMEAMEFLYRMLKFGVGIFWSGDKVGVQNEYIWVRWGGMDDTAGRGRGTGAYIYIYNLMVTRIDLVGVRVAEEPPVLG